MTATACPHCTKAATTGLCITYQIHCVGCCARLVMSALRVKDPEEWLEKMRDEHGNLLPASVWLDRTLAAGEERGEGA